MPADKLRGEIARVLRGMGVDDPGPIGLDRPRNPEHGDFASNVAMALAKRLGRPPRQVAEEIVQRMDRGAAGVSGAEVAGPGFINFRLVQDYLHQGLAEILAKDAAYGRSDAGQGQPVVVEFVSANPTGPLHIGHGRQAALGDAVSELMAWTGWKVHREYYYNDAGEQIGKLARSVWARYQQACGRDVPFPEDGYHGEYVTEIARALQGEEGERWAGDDSPEAFDAMRRFAVGRLMGEIERDLHEFRVRFDEYFLESSLYTGGGVEDTIRRLRATGLAYDLDGATWLRTTEYGDDKDRVMVKSTGHPTYFLPDVAYHVSKWERGFHRAINVQGADHHGTIARVRAGVQALGLPAGYPEYVLHQMVLVMRGGQEVKFSKRAGGYSTLRDLYEEAGVDVTRYFFLMRRARVAAHLRPGPGAGAVRPQPGLQGPVRPRPHVLHLPARRGGGGGDRRRGRRPGAPGARLRDRAGQAPPPLPGGGGLGGRGARAARRLRLPGRGGGRRQLVVPRREPRPRAARGRRPRRAVPRAAGAGARRPDRPPQRARPPRDHGSRADGARRIRHLIPHPCHFSSSAAWRSTPSRRPSAARTTPWAAPQPSSPPRPPCFCPVQLVGVVGDDYPTEALGFLSERGVDLRGLEQAQGESFRWSGVYSYDLNSRETLETRLGVFADFAPKIPGEFRDAEWVFLGNIDPELQLEVLDQVRTPKFVACDTMNLWIDIKRDRLLDLLARVDLLLVNDAEARQLSGDHNLARAARWIQSRGPRYLIIKKGEHGAILFTPQLGVLRAGLPAGGGVRPHRGGRLLRGRVHGAPGPVRAHGGRRPAPRRDLRLGDGVVRRASASRWSASRTSPRRRWRSGCGTSAR